MNIFSTANKYAIVSRIWEEVTKDRNMHVPIADLKRSRYVIGQKTALLKRGKALCVQYVLKHLFFLPNFRCPSFIP